jgi:hypothetical protein
MRLPDKAFARIRKSLGLEEPSGNWPAAGAAQNTTSAAQDTGGDRPTARREPRWRVNVDVPFARHGTIGGRLRTVALQDLSAVGACVVSTQQLGAGDRFILYLPWGQGEFVPVVCAVRTVRIRTDGKWRIGAEYVESGDALLRQRGRVSTANALGQDPTELFFRIPTDPKKPGAESPARKHARREAPGQATIYTYDDNGLGGDERRGPIEKVDARDVSDGGVSILRGEPFELGQRFVINLSAPGAESLTRLCKVVHVTLAHDRYRIGAQFVPFPHEPQSKAAPAQPLSQRLRRWFSGTPAQG